MKTRSRAICLQPSPANTVKRAHVDFTAPVIPLASSRNEIKVRQNHTTTKTYQPQTKPQRRKSPQPHSWFVPVFSVILLSASHLPGWAEGQGRLGSEPQSLSTVPGPHQVSRRRTRWKTKERSREIFQCA